MKSLDYIAGMFDGEGTFNCQLSSWQREPKKQPKRKPRTVMKTLLHFGARAQIGFKQAPAEQKFVIELKERFGGKNYISNDGKENGIVSWATVTNDQCVLFCETMLPLLDFKKEQCEKLLSIARLVKSKKEDRYKKGYLTRTTDIYTKEEFQMVIKIATTMNAGRQSNRFRNALGRNTEYYLKLVDKMYGG